MCNAWWTSFNPSIASLTCATPGGSKRLVYFHSPRSSQYIALPNIAIHKTSVKVSMFNDPTAPNRTLISVQNDVTFCAPKGGRINWKKRGIKRSEWAERKTYCLETWIVSNSKGVQLAHLKFYKFPQVIQIWRKWNFNVLPNFERGGPCNGMGYDNAVLHFHHVFRWKQMITKKSTRSTLAFVKLSMVKIMTIFEHRINYKCNGSE